MKNKNKIINGDCIEIMKEMPDESVDMIVTSPPYYGLRDYDKEDQIGLEETFEEYLQRLLKVTEQCKRVLKPKGTLWWVHGDSYAGDIKMDIPNKSLVMQPYRLAQRMIDKQNWILRNIIIWHKPSCMPESVKDRFTVDYEPVLFFSKNKNYYFEQQFEDLADSSKNDPRFNNGRETYNGKFDGKKSKQQSAVTIKSKGRNKRTVWSINPKPFKEAHFAVYPPKLIETPIKAGCPKEVCKECGEPKELEIKTKSNETRTRETGLGQDSKKGTKGRAGEPDRKIKGYKANCDCDSGFERGVVLDPFFGAGTTALVARQLGRNYIGIELNEDYIEIAEDRLKQENLI